MTRHNAMNKIMKHETSSTSSGQAKTCKNCKTQFQIEPDASSGSYFWAATGYDVSDQSETHSENGCAHTWSETLTSTVSLKHWPTSGWQVDAKFFDHLATITPFNPFSTEQTTEIERQMETLWGTNWRERAEQEHQEYLDRYHAEHGVTTISRRHDLGDSIMTAIVLTPLADHNVRFTDLGRLRVQECERVVALRTELTKCGAKVIEEGDTLTVHPSKLHGAEIETYSDHRMAMCFAILGLKVPGIKIKNPACVKKTFPNFFQKLAAPPPRGLGATILDGHTGRELEMEELFAD